MQPLRPGRKMPRGANASDATQVYSPASSPLTSSSTSSSTTRPLSSPLQTTSSLIYYPLSVTGYSDALGWRPLRLPRHPHHRRQHIFKPLPTLLNPLRLQQQLRWTHKNENSEKKQSRNSWQELKYQWYVMCNHLRTRSQRSLSVHFPSSRSCLKSR